MPCPSSPTADGYHKYQLAPQSDQATGSYTTDCLYCGEPKWIYPPKAPNFWKTAQTRGNAASNAAQRRKREAAE